MSSIKPKVLIFVGTGGVGKTTLAATWAAREAEAGQKVLVLTIDPSQRLKTTLGLDESGEVKRISHSRIKGQLDAAVMNPKKSFDEFISRVAKDPEKVQKILSNKLYVQLSTTLAGSQEFTALERLLTFNEKNQYDLIILDTPPAQHAMDFLRAPEKLSALFQEKLTKWFRAPDRASTGWVMGFLSLGTKQVLKALELLTGSDFIRELADFFQNIQAWQGKIDEQSQKVKALLRDPQTHFYLVSSYDRAKLKEALIFSRKIKEQGSHLEKTILNRAFPLWMLDFHPDQATTSEADQFALKWYKFDQQKRKSNLVLQELQGQTEEVLEIPEMPEDPRDLDGIFAMLDQVKEISK